MAMYFRVPSVRARVFVCVCMCPTHYVFLTHVMFVLPACCQAEAAVEAEKHAASGPQPGARGVPAAEARQDKPR